MGLCYEDFHLLCPCFLFVTLSGWIVKDVAISVSLNGIVAYGGGGKAAYNH